MQEGRVWPDVEAEEFSDPDMVLTVMLPRIPADIRSMEAYTPPPEPVDPATVGTKNLAGRLRALPWQLYLVLAVQLGLSFRLLRRNTASLDEATCLNAGHQMLAHWLHGAAVPQYAAYFPGAPVLYPPLAAGADHFGGIVAARLLSLAFMASATVLLWCTARRLHSDIAAFAGCAAFVALGATQSLGAFATFDSMALCLMSAGAYFAVRAAMAERRWLPWLVAAALAVTLGNATEYAAALWDPFVVLLFLVVLGRLGNRRVALIRAASLVAACTALLGIAVAVGGTTYVTGIRTTTFQHAAGSGIAPSAVVEDMKSWIGWVLLLCLIGFVAAVLRGERGNALGCLVCLAAACAAPANQIRIDAPASLFRHVGFGAWFACIAVGYLIQVLAHAMITAKEARVVGILITGGLIWVSGPGSVTQSAEFFGSWPDATNLSAAVVSDVHRGSQQYLAEQDGVLQYNLRGRSSWTQWHNTQGLTFYDAQLGRIVGGNEAYADAVLDHHFSLIILSGQDTPSIDAEIVHAIALCKDSCGYRLIANVPYQGTNLAGHFTVWQYQGAAK